VAAPFERLLRPHLVPLYRLAFRFTGSREDAEELVQELCVKMLPRLHELERLDRPGRWLARALHNLYVDLARHRKRSPVDAVDELPEIPADAPGPEELAAGALSAERLTAALMRLPPEQRAVIAWHDVEGYTLEELAEAHDTALGTLKSRLNRARNTLRRLLARTDIR